MAGQIRGATISPSITVSSDRPKRALLLRVAIYARLVTLIGRARRSVEVRPAHDVVRANVRPPEMPGVSGEHAGPQERALHA